ncbi:glycosyl hydrolase family 3 [Paenibacillus sp. FSL P4-0081]|uniref:glycoside hydrolase family 3 C-terminal domain-containing protein n=1 Tax=unclassified Paenibacillus TaxID=185978 RepID=UPI0004F86863|nr:glycoside hydrolase family 3 C-terminal domain-containing protein [Paenibacillus sp. FSL P4-0081]AIQ31500.1 glycosyl hydrolase family 3 [Paenibacillus sp. FSL P4-0081]
MNRDIKEVISKMTLEEKASLCSGISAWNTIALPEHGISSIMLTDGPHGLRKQTGAEDHMGLNNSAPATCFPTAAGLASSWNRELIEKVGTALGEECQAEGVSILLGPGTNIKRSPLCGRNFEYFSEDPYLSSELTTKHIQGVQSQGVGTSLKHFAANNQETKRFNIDAIIDERTLREIYLASFEGAIIEAQPWTVMAAYNKINGQFCSENRNLLTEVLRDEWGFKGFVVSDWGAVSERDAALSAGMDFEMPTSNGVGTKKIIDSVSSGSLSVETLDTAVERILEITFKALDSKKETATYDRNAHHELAREVAAESMVLLKNEDQILPLGKKGEIAVIGAFAKKPRYQGAGSSRVNPTKLDIPYDEIKSTCTDAQVVYAEGYSLNSDEINDEIIAEATKAASEAEVAIVFVGLPEKYDAEGVDRKHLRLPGNQDALIEAVAEAQRNTIIILLNGSAVEMPWVNKVKGIIEAYLGGQGMAGAVADLLFGDRNPSGKLAETFPEKLSHSPSYINFPGERDKVEYREGLFVGYRYYDKVEMEPLFPFGHGLSYTTFEYSDIRLNKKEINDTEEVTVTAKVKNTGNRSGKEVVQLYVKDVVSSVIRPVKELKGFEKVALEPGEEKVVTFKLGKRAFAYYHVELKDWVVESGEFEILMGKSSMDIELSETVYVHSTVKINKKYTLDSTLGDIGAELAGKQLVSKIIEGMGFGGSDSDAPFGMDLESLLHSLKLRIVEAHGGFPREKLEELLETLNSN